MADFLSVKANLSEIAAGFAKLKAKQIPFATAMALTNAVKVAQAVEQAALPSVFDRPTPFTLRSIAITPATKSSLSASVFVKDQQAAYLRLEETGGTRRPTKRALVMPVDARRNAYGNLPRKALQTLKARPDVFVGTVGGVGGVWQRMSGSLRQAGRKRAAGQPSKQPRGLKLLIAFDDQTTYKPRFGFRPRAISAIQASIGPAFAASLARALKTAR